MSLPHLDVCDERDLGGLVAELSSGRNRDEFYLAVSKGFWEAEEQDAYEAIFHEYLHLFDDVVKRLTDLIGEPDVYGCADEVESPDWAYGYKIAIWSVPSVWLRIEHEDRELPIIVALGPHLS